MTCRWPAVEQPLSGWENGSLMFPSLNEIVPHRSDRFIRELFGLRTKTRMEIGIKPEKVLATDYP
jgi:hypothetical protein